MRQLVRMGWVDLLLCHVRRRTPVKDQVLRRWSRCLPRTGEEHQDVQFPGAAFVLCWLVRKGSCNKCFAHETSILYSPTALQFKMIVKFRFVSCVSIFSTKPIKAARPPWPMTFNILQITFHDMLLYQNLDEPISEPVALIHASQMILFARKGRSIVFRRKSIFSWLFVIGKR